MPFRRFIGSVLLVGIVAALGVGLGAWKYSAIQRADAEAASQPESAEAVAVAVAREREHRPTTTSIGTVIAQRSISVRNELSGTVKSVALSPGEIVEAGKVLVALDVSVETAELQALQAQAELAQTQYARMQRMFKQRAASEMEVDTALAERDIAIAQIARTQAVIERKTIRAPFRARIGLSDVHPGQYLNEGTLLTTLQGVDEQVYVDFTVAQQIAAELRPGGRVDVLTAGGPLPVSARILAIDARVDPTTRNGSVRAQIATKDVALAPGASVRVQVAVGEARPAIAIPASAVRKGPEGDHVFVLIPDDVGHLRARVRQVRVETASGDEALIESGLSAGERVAASGSFKLRDSALVAVMNPPQSVALNVDRPTSTAF